jgi:radical SAM superfamily enzyme YgiQ (UPF0313 family)
MIGLPTETDEDLDEIVRLSEKIVEIYYEQKRRRQVSITVSISNFIPKPFTPFERERMNTLDELREKQQRIKSKFRKKQIRLSYHEAKQSMIEGLISRGDERLSAVIIESQRQGARFDGWSEHFNYDLWMNALTTCGLDISDYLRGRGADEHQPWDNITL